MNPLEFDKTKYITPAAAFAIYETIVKMYQHFGNHDRILISVSGGSDSDCIIHLVCKYFPEYLHKCVFVWVDTGLEYEATKRHLQYIETKYDIKIEHIRGKSVVWAVKKYGMPILSKDKSQIIQDYMRGCPYAIKKINQSGRYGFTDQQKSLLRYIEENKVLISKKCCDVSKKKPLYEYMKANGIDLNVTGERYAEGGLRASSHKTCFECKPGKIDKYMPLWFWPDGVKTEFKHTEQIRFSDCYEIYGMKRTGCCGCPYNLNIGHDLQIMRQYEPKLYKACMSVFGQAYELTDRFNCRKRKCLPEKGVQT